MLTAYASRCKCMAIPEIFFEANGPEITEGISPALLGVAEAAGAGSPLARGIDQQGKAQE